MQLILLSMLVQPASRYEGDNHRGRNIISSGHLMLMGCLIPLRIDVKA